ncbi:alpha/beta hydrolase [Nocardia sp. NPDC057030]|uniref:alpha/beta hydrolase n=1 Tax=unclassified Nocardia TaxID=2637762 RepID=UPI003645CD73
MHGPRLAGYLRILRITHQGRASTNTVVGYSYVAVTAGHAATQPVHADNLVFMGSAGAGVERAADLHLVGVLTLFAIFGIWHTFRDWPRSRSAGALGG